MSETSSDSNSSDNNTPNGGEKRRYQPRSDGAGYDNNNSREGARFDQGNGDQGQDRIQNAAMEVTVENNIEKAMKVLKRKLIKEGLFKELKSRKYFEKPSERKKRKKKESVKKVRKDVLRSRKNAMLLS